MSDVSNSKTKAAQAKAFLNATLAVSDAIRELGSVPSGHLYARLMEYLSIEVYQRIIDLLVEAKVVTNKGHLLTWVGQKPQLCESGWTGDRCSLPLGHEGRHSNE